MSGEGTAPRIVFLPDRPVDREGDLFSRVVEELGLTDYEIDGDPATADFVAYIGRERASTALGRRVKTGLVRSNLYVLPSTAPEERRHFYEGQWRSFAARVLGRDLAVRDEYKGMAPEEIKAALDKKRFPFAVCVANVEYDFNLGTIIRNANAFLAREVVIFGRRKMDLRGAMGAHVYENIVHVRDAEALRAHARERGYALVCFEESPGAMPLAEFSWPPDPLMIFGQEGPGIPEEVRALADATVFIPLLGSMRSINVGVASGIAMNDWHTRACPGRRP
ncbi:MAG TPA: TrmH family RNA methyltransferase [Planctomycetota bacterium]|nr:TrmH family RNA methyltransferase [Planctomycetota bacterium]